MENDGFLDALADAFRKTQCVSAPKEAVGAFIRFKYDYEEACKQQNAQFTDQIASQQWEKLESDSKQEYARLSKRDSELYSKLLSKYNHINSLGKKKSDGSVLFYQEKGSKSNQNLQQQWDMLSQEEKKIYEAKAKQNQQDTIKSLIEDYILEYKNYENNLKEKPENIKFINKQEEENDEIDQIDIIIGIKRINGKKEYLVRFKGKTGKDAKWFPKKRLRKVKDLVKEFEDAYFRQSFQDEEPSSGFDSTPAISEEKVRQEIDINEIEHEQEVMQIKPLDQPIQTQPFEKKIIKKKKIEIENDLKQRKSIKEVTKKIKKTIQNQKLKETKSKVKNKKKQNPEISQSKENSNKQEKNSSTNIDQKQLKYPQKQFNYENTHQKSTRYQTQKEKNQNKQIISQISSKPSISASKRKTNNAQFKQQKLSASQSLQNSNLIQQINKLDKKKQKSQPQKEIRKMEAQKKAQNIKGQMAPKIKSNNKKSLSELNVKKKKKINQQLKVQQKITNKTKQIKQSKPTPQILKKQIRKQIVTRQLKKKIKEIQKPLTQPSKKPTYHKNNSIQEIRTTQRKLRRKN